MVFLLCSAALSEDAHARRAALVIGINDYAEVDDLQKAVGDARAMSETLRGLGFDVTEVIDADRRSLNQAISTFTATLVDGDTAFVHFSGHGVEIGGENYLLPADIPIPGPGQSEFVKSEAVAMSDLVARIALGGARTRVFVIDACRNNPFEQAGVRSVGGTRGLARVEAPAGTFIMYSAGYRQLALDALGPDDAADTSVYTRTLIQHLATPGRPIDDIAQDVRREVEQMARSIGHDQRPAYYDELSARLILVEPEVAVVTPGPPPPPPPPPPAGGGEAAQVWGTIQTTESIAVLEAFVEQYPDSVFSKFALARLDELRGAKPDRDNGRNQRQETSPAASVLIEQAHSLSDAGDHAGAFNAASQAADQGDPEGMFLVAYAHDFGEGVPINDVESSRWYLRAAEAGHEIAQFNLAWNYEHGEGVSQNGPEAVRWYTAAAQQGNDGAMLNLGLMYDNGDLIAQDYLEAARWYERAVELDNPAAMLQLGVLYDEGRGLKIDDREAVRLYRQSAAQGNVTATLYMGLMYAGGEGVAQDYAEAARWYREAADLGSDEAMLYLGVLYDEGRGVELDDVEALRLYKLAAEAGNAVANFNTALMYDYGEGTKVNDVEAIRWYTRAAELGHTTAMWNLGVMYETGEGTDVNPRLSARYVRDAIVGGEENAAEQIMENANSWSRGFRNEFQRILRDEGVYDGDIDGQYGPATRRAIQILAGR